MNYHFPPVSRLTLVFILAVLVSGSILTYFSINNISNLKELTEKSILEEQRELTTRFFTELENQIKKITGLHQQKNAPPSLFTDSLIQTETEHDFIQQSFLFHSDGTFLYPNFSEIAETPAKLNKTEQLGANYSKAEAAEFRENNLARARKFYQLALKDCQNPEDSAHVLISLGRVSVKMDDPKTAFNHYSAIVSKYYDLTDVYGIPFVNYALQQFTQMRDTTLTQQVLNMGLNCLEKMSAGKIPLTYQTTDLLLQFSDKVQFSSQENDSVRARINELILNINRQINFVNSRKNVLTELIKSKKTENQKNAINSFQLINSFSYTPAELLLVNSDSSDYWGFLINGEMLLEKVLQQDLQKEMQFNYSFSFPAVYSSNNQHYLTSATLLNPYFSGRSLQIKLFDENALTNIIKRRSWIYGISSVLLLVAMFLGVYLILRDIAREKRLAQLRSDFISNVTHELKTPLTSIYMFTESLLLGRIINSKMQDEYLSIVLKESERLKRMINNILEFSRAEKGIPEYHFVKSNLADVIQLALKEMEYWFEKETFEVKSDLDKNIELAVDPEKMKQAFVNLISNALKYSNSEKKLNVRLYKDDSKIHIEFEDKGIGIPEELQSQIFEKFYRADPKEGISGTGLGLTVVKEIVAAHKGKIIVDSQVGKGSKFSIILYQKGAEV